MPNPGKWQNRLRGHGARWTAPRRAVVDLLSQTKKHMSAKEVYASLHRMYPGMGLTTVYRTLDLLVRMGLLNRLSFGTGESRYEFKSGEKDAHHHHLICVNCGKIVDYRDFVDEELQLVRKTEESLARKHGFRIMDHNVEFYGLCPQCRD
jgi:Fur family ferric uptake transcriptional regulator